MKTTSGFAALLTLSAITVAGGCAPLDSRLQVLPESSGAEAAAGDEVRNIILMIADGTGAGVWTAAEYANDRLAVKRMPVVGLVDTRSALHKVTDSAAGASVYATGERSVNRTISVGPPPACPQPRRADADTGMLPEGCEPLPTWFELAHEAGKATGLVTTTSVVDATPAAFVAHSPSRYWGDFIASQVAAFQLDVLLGGGARSFSPGTRADGRDLLGEMCGRAHCLSAARELESYRPDDRPLVGLFADGDMDEFEPRPAGLPAMVGAALAKLGRGRNGFVAMFESEATDNSTHGNMPLERVTADILEFDRAVEVALDFAERTPGTLLIVTADHETGGFSLVEDGSDFVLHYTTHGHTASMVPLFAFGPQSERFGGLRENYEVGRLLLEIAGGW